MKRNQGCEAPSADQKIEQGLSSLLSRLQQISESLGILQQALILAKYTPITTMTEVLTEAELYRSRGFAPIESGSSSDMSPAARKKNLMTQMIDMAVELSKDRSLLVELEELIDGESSASISSINGLLALSSSAKHAIASRHLSDLKCLLDSPSPFKQGTSRLSNLQVLSLVYRSLNPGGQSELSKIAEIVASIPEGDSRIIVECVCSLEAIEHTLECSVDSQKSNVVQLS